MEGIVIAPDNTFWMVDEYRPAIYHFNQDGSLIDRFVPQGTAALAGAAVGTFGSETLPEEYANRRPNRGFEGVALDTDENILYAFIQTPLANPDRDASDNSDIIRVLGIDPTTGNAVSEYVYLLQDPDERDGGRVDKIGDAVYAGDGKFYVIERDSAVGETANKYIFQIDLTGATNILDRDLGDSTLEQLATADALAAEGIQAVNKLKVTNLPSIGYDAGDKPEGLALLPDGRLAVLNDNDFGLLDEEIPLDGTVPLNPNPVPVVLGIMDLGENNALDGSDRDDAIKIENAPVFGLYQPDGITSFAVDGNTYYITANEGDSRDEDERIEDLNLDPDAFPNGEVLQSEEELGRLEASTIDGDLDGDGDYDQLFVYGARSFTIWDSFGNLVFDSGDDFEQITAAEAPLIFNSQGQPDSFDNRSDNKGPEPESVVTGVVGNSTYAFIGLEQPGGIMVYDVTEPANVSFVQYLPSPEGDISPEGLAFIAPEDSPNGQPLLVVANEVSGTTTVFAIDEVAINEIRIDQSSDDNDEYFELAAAPGFPLDNLTYVVIGDGENGEGGSGVVEAVVDLSGQVVGESGFFVVAEDTFSLATADFTANLNFENSDNVTHLLVEGFNGADGDDLDTDDDGVLDVTPWSRIVDGVGLKENDEGELLYSDTVVGPDGDFVPAHVFRSSDFTGNWAIGDFSLGAQDTPGAANFEFLSTTIPAIQGEPQLIFGSAEDDEFTVGVTPEFDGEEDLLFSGAGEDLIDLVGANTPSAALRASGSRVYSGSDNDELFAGSEDRLFGGAGDDTLEASAGGGGNRLYGGDGNDELIAGEGDRLFGNDGDDTLEASVGGGDNRLYGGDGDDWFFLGEGAPRSGSRGDRLVGGEGDDTFFVGTGGDNVITGGEGADTFWIADGEVPESVNTITDFELEVDVVGLGGLGIGSVQELSFQNLGEGGAIGFNGQDLAVFLGVDATDLQANATFVFG